MEEQQEQDSTDNDAEEAGGDESTFIDLLKLVGWILLLVALIGSAGFLIFAVPLVAATLLIIYAAFILVLLVVALAKSNYENVFELAKTFAISSGFAGAFGLFGLFVAPQSVRISIVEFWNDLLSMFALYFEKLVDLLK